ncbi:MAG TPA: pyrroloquinoline quinone biosynthesis protein PqqB [Polyangiales bacterium]
MHIRILGSAAGGGFPQWNCACANCDDVRRGRPGLTRRTQDSIAVSADGNDWFLFNASPDLLQQLATTSALWPRAPRHTPLAGILLGNGDLDHILGLFSLRESTPLVLYATDAVRQGLEEQNAIFWTLKRFPEQMQWRRLQIDEPISLHGAHGAASGLVVTPFAAAGKRPLHLERRDPDTVGTPEDNVGFEIHDTQRDKRCLYLSAAVSLSGLLPRIERADVLLFDGTFWTSDELIALGLGTSRAEDMAHLPVGGTHGSLAQLARISGVRKVFTHINNTNPMLRVGSPEQRSVLAAGVEIAYDGMEITL